MKKTTAYLTTSLGLVLGSLHAQNSTVPAFINYQGRVTDSTGAGLGASSPVNRKVIFRIYDVATGGVPLWSEEHTVTISNGEFSVLLGNGIPASYQPTTPAKTIDKIFTSPACCVTWKSWWTMPITPSTPPMFRSPRASKSRARPLPFVR